MRASAENQFPPQGFPGPSSYSGYGGSGGHARPVPSTATAGGGLNNLDGPGIGGTPQRPVAPMRAMDPMGPGGNPPNQLNNLNQPPLQVKLISLFVMHGVGAKCLV